MYLNRLFEINLEQLLNVRYFGENAMKRN